MITKEQELINKGYSKDIVLKVCGYTEEELEKAVNTAMGLLTNKVSSVSNPKCIFIGGQPGVGKSVLSDKLKRSSNSVEISMDACRMFHPHYEEMEHVVKDFYKGKEISIENNPGNDIASFTQDFAGDMANKLIDKISDIKYNILLEWNMRKSNDVLSCMNLLANKGYINEAIVVAVNKNTSLEACKIRANVMNGNGHIIRKVSDSFHQMCLDTIPPNVDRIYLEGKKNNILKKMDIVLRDGKIIWNSDNTNIHSITLPSTILNEYYNNIELTKDYKNNPKWAQIAYEKESLGLKADILNINKEEIALNI